MTSRFAALCIDARDPEVIVQFWCGVLKWSVIERGDEVITIAAADGAGPHIDVLAVPEAKEGKNRLHLDLRADGCSTATELARLFALGAQRVDVGQQAEVSWVVLADPEGNEFCLLSNTVQEVESEG